MSSTPNKRSIDETGNGSGNFGHSSATKYNKHEDSSSFPDVGPKVMSLFSGESHAPYEVGQDSRMPKFPHTESHDADRKDPNESLGGKRYLDTPGGNMDPGHTSRSSLHVSGEKDAAPFKKKDYAETREAVGENKVNLRGDDKFKDKDKKRNDGKHREWGEKDKDRKDRRNDSENMDLIKNERETQRQEKERKDLCKGKENVKDEVKERITKEVGTGAEIDGLHNEKDLLDVLGKVADPENSTTELKKVIDGEDLKTGDKGPRDKKRDRDINAEERFVQCKRLKGKESDEGCRGAEGSTRKEREGFSHGIQQRKGMLRPKGSPLRSNHDPASRFRNHDTAGSQGEADVPTVIYKVGESMPQLIKSWKEFKSSHTNRMSETPLISPTLVIRIPAEHVSATNRQVRGGQLWGTDVYTDDSDLVAVLMHTSYFRPNASPQLEKIREFRITIRVLPPQDYYVSSLRNHVRSRAWGSGIGCSYRVEDCCIVMKKGGLVYLEPCLTHSSTLEPTLAPVRAERTMTTRAATSKALRQQRFVREFTIQFNLCLEPWLKYSISVIGDMGMTRANYTSSRIKKGEVLYLETHTCRYELCYNGEKMVKKTTSTDYQAHDEGENGVIDVFRWSLCKKALPQKKMTSVGIPLPSEHVQVLEDNLEWGEIRWSTTSVHINGKDYSLVRAHFLSLH